MGSCDAVRDDDALLLLALGALVVMGAGDNAIPDPSGWWWPVPDLLAPGDPPRPSVVYYPATVSQEFRKPDHVGVDIMYRRDGIRDMPQYPRGHDGSVTFFAPPGTPVYAARDGTVWSAGMSPRGISVVLDHGRPFATFYQHLADTVFPMGTHDGRDPTGKVITVKGGDLIGHMGYDPIDPEGLRHLHFAVWKDGAGDSASVDPTRSMRNWKRTAWRLT